jgi:small subunit ribosomal protein S18
MAREEKEKTPFQSFSKPKVKVTRHSASGTEYVDYKDTESLRKMMTGNGKIHNRKRTGVTAMEQRKVGAAIKRARYMSLLPYATSIG